MQSSSVRFPTRDEIALDQAAIDAAYAEWLQAHAGQFRRLDSTDAAQDAEDFVELLAATADQLADLRWRILKRRAQARPGGLDRTDWLALVESAVDDPPSLSALQLLIPRAALDPSDCDELLGRCAFYLAENSNPQA